MFPTTPFKSIIELLAAFPTEQAAIEHFEWVRWQGNIVSPFDPESKVYKCSGNRYKCANTKKYFNCKTSTIFEGSKIPLRTWFLATYLFTVSKRGISSYTLAEELSVTQKTAWFMLSRLRYGMVHPNFLKEFTDTVECDETYVGGKNKNRHKDKKVEQSQGRSYKDKTPIFGMLERKDYEIVERPHKNNPEKTVKEKIVHKDSQVKCVVVPDTKRSTIQPIIFKEVVKGVDLMTDEWWAYRGMNKHYNHGVVDHGKKQYVNGNIYTNTLESFWGNIKRSIIGIYYHVSRKHLQKYADEITFRFNFKTKTVSEKFNLFLQSVNGKRLTYQTLIHG